jgi:hypothetical protein
MTDAMGLHNPACFSAPPQTNNHVIPNHFSGEESAVLSIQKKQVPRAKRPSE